MTNNDKITELEWHRKQAVALFNHTWDLIDKGEKRTSVESNEMIHSAHASRYHWGAVVNSGKYPESGPINLERGDWLISRVYSLLNMPQMALYHAKQCLDTCLQEKIGGLDLAFAYEAMARANSITKSSDEASKYIKLAEKASVKIAKEEDKKYFLSELESIEF